MSRLGTPEESRVMRWRRRGGAPRCLTTALRAAASASLADRRRVEIMSEFVVVLFRSFRLQRVISMSFLFFVFERIAVFGGLAFFRQGVA